MLSWRGTCAAPSNGDGALYRARRSGVASFRMSSFGDVSHLYAGGREPSFAARFCGVQDLISGMTDGCFCYYVSQSFESADK